MRNFFTNAHLNSKHSFPIAYRKCTLCCDTDYEYGIGVNHQEFVGFFDISWLKFSVVANMILVMDISCLVAW